MWGHRCLLACRPRHALVDMGWVVPCQGNGPVELGPGLGPATEAVCDLQQVPASAETRGQERVLQDQWSLKDHPETPPIPSESVIDDGRRTFQTTHL